MSSADADGVAVSSRQQTQHLGSLRADCSACLCRDELRVIVHYRRGVYDKVGALDILGSLTDEHLYPHPADSIESFGLVVVRAGDIKAL